MSVTPSNTTPPNNGAPPSNTPQDLASSGAFVKFLNIVERLGNLLPHPITLFAMFCLAVIALSGIAGYFELTVADPRPIDSSGRSEDGLIHVVSLMNAEGLRMIVSNLVTNFTGFTPLGTVLVALLGVGIAERSGLLFCSNAFIGHGGIKTPCHLNHCVCRYRI